MKRTSLWIGVILLVAVWTLLTISCGKTAVRGQVVDAETGKPIAGAAIHIFWGKPGSGPPGLRGKDRVDVAETLSDADGRFEIPKYRSFFKHFYMAVYKQGYVCWSNRKVFPSYTERSDFRLNNGMVIKLEHFKSDYSHSKHVDFIIVASAGRVGQGVFDKSIESEIRLIQRKYPIKNEID